MIPHSPKEFVIRIARHVLGENRVHDYLIKRGIERRHLNNGYVNTPSNECRPASYSHDLGAQVLVFMADGKWMHGGLTDRLRGIVSAYKFATEHNLDFKIFHTSPFALQEILQPNKVNWIIDEKDIFRNSSIAKPVLLYREDFDNDSALERQLDSCHKQFHLYSCVDTVGERFSEFFNDLFTPSPLLKNELEHYEKILGTNYTSISYRFQNKLGDFREFIFKELPPKDQQKLLSSAILALQNEIETIQSSQELQNQRPLQKQQECPKVLVTADSPTFLAEVSKLNNIVFVKGKSIHIDFNGSKNATDYLKAFTEFFLISKAKSSKLYRNIKFNTYPSNFPKYAALLGHVSYEIIED